MPSITIRRKDEPFVRPATRADIPAVMRLKQALNEAEQVGDLTPCSEQDWLRDIFGPEPLFSVAVAECDKIVVGIAIYNRKRVTGWTGSILYLQDLFVEDAYRRRGIATLLLRHVAEAATSGGMAVIELDVRVDNPARELYRRAGFDVARCLTYVIAGSALMQLADAGLTCPVAIASAVAVTSAAA